MAAICSASAELISLKHSVVRSFSFAGTLFPVHSVQRRWVASGKGSRSRDSSASTISFSNGNWLSRCQSLQTVPAVKIHQLYIYAMIYAVAVHNSTCPNYSSDIGSIFHLLFFIEKAFSCYRYNALFAKIATQTRKIIRYISMINRVFDTQQIHHAIYKNLALIN